MRIALIITELEPGGAEQCMVNLARFLANRGHHVHVLALGRTPSRALGASVCASELTRQLDKVGIPCSCGPAAGWTSLLPTIRWLREQLVSIQPDVIQSMLFHANVITALANRRQGKPHFGGVRVGRQAWWRGRLQRWASRGMHRVICVSQQVAQDCRIREGIQPKKLVVIPNGIRMDPLPDAASPQVIQADCREAPESLQQLFPQKRPPYFLFVGRLSEQKGILPLIRSAGPLLQPLTDHHLIVLGDGPLREEVERQAAASPVADRIHLLGWQPNVEKWMRFAEALLLPSKYEGMPNVVLEAMSFALPVVAFDVEGVRELLGGSAHQIAAPGDFDQFLQLARQLAVDADLSSSLRRANRSRVAENFQLDELLERYEQLYLEAF